MTRFLGSILMLIAASGALLADATAAVPEIDVGSTATALGLLSGGLLVLRSGRRR